MTKFTALALKTVHVERQRWMSIFYCLMTTDVPVKNALVYSSLLSSPHFQCPSLTWLMMKKMTVIAALSNVPIIRNLNLKIRPWNRTFVNLQHHQKVQFMLILFLEQLLSQACSKCMRGSIRNNDISGRSLNWQFEPVTKVNSVGSKNFLISLWNYNSINNNISIQKHCNNVAKG